MQLGFADQVGTLTDAIEVLGELTKLGKKPEIFEPPKEYNSIMEFITSNQSESSAESKAIRLMTNQLKIMGQPLFMMKGTYLE